MTKICLQCNKEFESKRIDAKFCSDKCQKRNVRDNPKTLNVRDNVRDNKCKYCGKPLDWDLQTTCYDCVKARKDLPITESAWYREEQKEAANIMKNLEKKSVETLREEETWIPNWKRSGSKSRKEALKELWSIIQQHEGRYVFQGYKIDTSEK